MRHAREEDLTSLSELLEELRRVTQLREKGFGVFYRRSRSFLHFHVDSAKLYADVRLGDEFERIAMDSVASQNYLVKEIHRVVGDEKLSGGTGHSSARVGE